MTQRLPRVCRPSSRRGGPLLPAVVVLLGLVVVLAVLRAATRDAAILAGRGARSGLVEPGRDADLLLVRGDPLADPSVLRTPRAVILGGRLVRGG